MLYKPALGKADPDVLARVGLTESMLPALLGPRETAGPLAFGSPSLEFDVDAQNEHVRAECLKRRWPSLAVLLPPWPAAWRPNWPNPASSASSPTTP